MTSNFITPENPLWKQLLEQSTHDFYHLPEYVSFAAQHEGGQPCAFVAERHDQALLIPLLKKSLPPQLNAPGDLCDLTSPYGYAGPLIIGNPCEETLAEMLQSFRDAGRDLGAISSFWRLHPLLSFPLEPLGQIGSVVQHGRTVYVDLSQSTEQHWCDTYRCHRQHIKKLQSNGFTAVRNEWSYFPAFIAAYQETMSRVKARNFYCFSQVYFEDLRSVLGDKLDLWVILSPAREVAAGALVITVNGLVQYHLGATCDHFQSWSPNKLIVSEVRSWAQQAGHRLLHLGGGVGAKNDSLYTFKSRFSPLTAVFHTFRTVLLPDIYRRLQKKRFGSDSSAQKIEEGFFPSYRTP